MIHVPSVLTSKYSTPVKRSTTFLGRVIWFLVVFLASTEAPFQGNKDILPRCLQHQEKQRIVRRPVFEPSAPGIRVLLANKKPHASHILMNFFPQLLLW
jgi:hypothetical protein